MTTPLPATVGVYGGGRMGAGIAHAFLAGGAEVVVVEVDVDAAAAARQRVQRIVGTAHARGSGRAPDVVLPALRTAVEPEALAGCALVVEAVPESVEVKVAVLREIERAAPDAVLATNTSSISVDTLAESLQHPERLLGLHFFNPVPASELVEVVVGSSTSPDLVNAAQAWITGLGKTAVTVKDSPGFASSRLGLALALEAMRMVEEEVASPEDIDAAMTLGYKHQMGPLRTTDVVGLDVRLAIADQLAREVGQRFAPPAVLRGEGPRRRPRTQVGAGVLLVVSTVVTAPSAHRLAMAGAGLADIERRLDARMQYAWDRLRGLYP